jgi:hypothetical protein
MEIRFRIERTLRNLAALWRPITLFTICRFPTPDKPTAFLAAATCCAAVKPRLIFPLYRLKLVFLPPSVAERYAP